MMFAVVCVVLAALTQVGTANSGCPSAAWLPFQGNCYLKERNGGSPMMYTAARTICANHVPGSSRAVEVFSQAEHNWLVSVFGWVDTWIGMRTAGSANPANKFFWESGTAVTFTQWDAGFPIWVGNKDCVYMSKVTGKWRNEACMWTAPQIICKTPITAAPTQFPTQFPTHFPTKLPTKAPTTKAPTKLPTKAPTTKSPTQAPTKAPTTKRPTNFPTKAPTTKAPTQAPTKAPTTKKPTQSPTSAPTFSPSTSPTSSPTLVPTRSPVEADDFPAVRSSEPSSAMPMVGAGAGVLVLGMCGALVITMRKRSRGVIPSSNKAIKSYTNRDDDDDDQSAYSASSDKARTSNTPYQYGQQVGLREQAVVDQGFRESTTSFGSLSSFRSSMSSKATKFLFHSQTFPPLPRSGYWDKNGPVPENMI